MTAKHEPTEKTRDMVKTLSGYGLQQPEIARLIGISDKTLRKVYRDELDDGDALAKAQIGRSIFDQAVGREAKFDDRGNMVMPAIPPDRTAAIFLSKVRLGFKETAVVEQTGKDGGPIQTTSVDLAALSREELILFRQLVAKAEARKAAGGAET